VHISNIPKFVEFMSELVKVNGYVATTTPNMDDIFNGIQGKLSPSIKII
jgi:hypothetical protein